MTSLNGIGSNYIQGGNTIDRPDAAKTAQAKLAGNATQTSTAHDAASLSTGCLLAAAATNTDDIRADKVESLRAAINSGTYHVAAADVADAVVKNMLE